jgi:hypothetical protein
MTYAEALKACRPNGVSAQVIYAVPDMIKALELVEAWSKTVPNEDDLSDHMGPANYARAEMFRALSEALALVRS